MPQMIQKKQLNERVNKKNVREPYFLVQIKNKMFWTTKFIPVNKYTFMYNFALNFRMNSVLLNL